PRRRSGNGLDVEGYRSPKPLSGTCCSIANAIGGSANVCAGTTGRVRAGSNPEGRRTDKATIQHYRQSRDDPRQQRDCDTAAVVFTPQADRDTIAPDPPHRTPIAGPVPGVQINARIVEDPQGQARVLIRLPDNWNGRRAHPARAANSTAILPGVITSCRKAMPTSHKTKVLLI